MTLEVFFVLERRMVSSWMKNFQMFGESRNWRKNQDDLKNRRILCFKEPSATGDGFFVSSVTFVWECEPACIMNWDNHRRTKTKGCWAISDCSLTVEVVYLSVSIVSEVTIRHFRLWTWPTTTWHRNKFKIPACLAMQRYAPRKARSQKLNCCLHEKTQQNVKIKWCFFQDELSHWTKVPHV